MEKLQYIVDRAGLGSGRSHFKSSLRHLELCDLDHLTLFASISCKMSGEGHGKPLQCLCQENPKWSHEELDVTETIE